MTLSKLFAGAAMSAGLAAVAVTADATIVSQDLSGPDTSFGAFYWGETFITASGGPWNKVSVNFYAPSGAPAAAGVGYIFSSPYAGTPNGLPGAGALATSSIASGGVWQFAPGFTLASATQYYFYEDGLVLLTGNAFSAINSYSFTGDPNANFALISGVEINYTVNGSAVPEPATWALMLVGIGCLGAAMRGARRKESLATA